MKLCVITHTPHWQEAGDTYAYGPYVREMNLWYALVDEVTVVAPLGEKERSAIHWKHDLKEVSVVSIPSISLVRFRESVKTIVSVPAILYRIYKAMRKADHIHLRCPGNIGMLGTMVQVLFPSKKKTAKYAGNWDPASKQPISYRFQKWLLGNTTLTKNMQVLAYGEWPEQSKNIKSFFTATYTNADKKDIAARSWNQEIRFMYVGTMGSNKRPQLAYDVTKKLIEKGYNIKLDYYGEGPLFNTIKEQADTDNLTSRIVLHGNQPAAVVAQAYENSHFLFLFSKSEGWPKVLAEAMWHGAIPVSTQVSCVPWMLDYGNRGVLIAPDVERIVADLEKQLRASTEELHEMSINAMEWSRKYTLERFQSDIKELL